MKAYVLLLGISVILVVPRVLADKVYAAVASNFSQSMRILVKEFETTTGHKVELTFGSSGKFYAQIKQGAPYDLFFSADQAKPVALEQEKMIVAGSRFTYAMGRLALWSAKAEFNQQVEERFKSNSYEKLAMANPKLAPYGLAAIQVLSNLQMYKANQPTWIQGENVSQVYQFVHSGNADLGFVALSQVFNQHTPESRYWVLPETLYQPIKQDAVWLQRAKDNLAAQALWNFMQSEKALAIISQQGYHMPKVTTL